jgi:hypothetical protein
MVVQVELQRCEDAVEQPTAPQPGEAIVDGLVRTEAFGQVAPGGAGVEPPQDGVEHQPVVFPLAARFARARREQGSQQFPLLVGEFVSFHT